ncbi:MAG TPA: selenoneine synthase SenA [Verrucomicrobiae bacterium]|jgi:iron(II)-dependent oxidoreductase|nr:selenoneine synthase SenA [Verrucomicrobiae bacterium]
MSTTPPSTAVLAELLNDARSRTLELVADLDDEQMIGPRLAIVNPPLWEIGHVAWFQEFWTLRHLGGQRPLVEGGDSLYNSADVAHDTRWDLRLPSRKRTLAYMSAVLEQVIEGLRRGDPTPEDIYFHLLVLFHEDMHGEALAYTRQTLGYPPPRLSTAQPFSYNGSAASGDVEVPGGTFMLGAAPDSLFVFDNEKWEHPVEVERFRIARAAVTNREFAAFVDDGGYQRKELWSEAGRRWLENGGSPALAQSFAKFFNREQETVRKAESAGIERPFYWKKSDGKWLQRVFDQWLPLQESLPVMHVNWYEADAYAKWARRRLPTEAEWEMTAAAEPESAGCGIVPRKRTFPWGDEAPTLAQANLDGRLPGPLPVGALAAGDSAFGCRQMIGNVWEWTASDFRPYPEFTADPYKEYSAPWFGTHKVLRGGCWVTRARLIRNTWRNFYTPDRRDVWAGFRTCVQ